MGEIESINGRIQLIIDEVYNGNVSEFERASNIKPSTIKNIVGGRQTKPSYDVLESIVRNNVQISSDWLLTGEGKMLREENPSNGIIIPLAHSKTPEKTVPMSVFNLYDIDISAGLTRLFAEDGDRRKAFLGQISIPNMPKCDGAVKVIGDSMYPLLKSGDIIAYREIHNIEAIQWGEIYILQLEYDSDISVVVKYVKKSELGSDHVLLVSYNKEHDPKDIEIKNITAIARVILCIRQMSMI